MLQIGLQIGTLLESHDLSPTLGVGFRLDQFVEEEEEEVFFTSNSHRTVFLSIYAVKINGTFFF